MVHEEIFVNPTAEEVSEISVMQERVILLANVNPHYYGLVTLAFTSCSCSRSSHQALRSSDDSLRLVEVVY